MAGTAGPPEHAVIRAGLATAALGLGLLAALAGEPFPPVGASRALACAIEAGEGRLGIVELGRWLRARRAGLLVVDLRSDSAYRDFHLPTAERRDLAGIMDLASDRSRTIVLYGDAGPEPAQAWVLLRARGLGQVYYVEDAIRAWLGGIMGPVLPSDATPDELAAWPEVRALSRYFGGFPRQGGLRAEVGPLAWTGQAAAPAESTRVMLSRARRQGCGF